MSGDDISSDERPNGGNDGEEEFGDADGFEPAETVAESSGNKEVGRIEGDPEALSSQQRLDRKRERLEQRELGLDKRAEDLESREDALEDRETTLDQREADLENYRQELTEREDGIADREASLDERAQQLKERAAELDEKEQTLHEYVDNELGDIETSIDETVQESVSNALVHYDSDPSRLGTTGRLLVGLAGIALLAGGVANTVAALADYTTVLNSTTANFVLSAGLLLVGLSATLGVITTRG